jgi:Ca-activated chloride channel family protein
MQQLQECGLIAKDETAVCPLLAVQATANVVGRTARVEITQIFENTLSKPMEAVYRFPLSQDATLCGFRAVLGERVLEGVVEEREKAFEKYDRAMEKGHGAYLLDEERPNILTLSVGNLPPGRKAQITLEYVEILETAEETVRFRLPMSISPRYVPEESNDSDAIPVEYQIHPKYEASVPYGLHFTIQVHGAGQVISVESPSHPVRTRFEGNVLCVETVSDSVRMDCDFVLLIRRKDLNEPQAWISETEEEIFCRVDIPCDDPQELKQTGEIFFVLDASGSMMGSSYEQAQQALEIMLKALPEDVDFNLCRFGSTYELLWQKPRPATEKNVRQALSYLYQSTADLGGTEMLDPLKEIYDVPLAEGAVRNIVLLTDGEIANEHEIFALASSKKDSIRIFAVGIGYGPNDYLIREVARASGGESIIVSPDERLEGPVLRLFRGLSGPVYRDVEILWLDGEQVPERVVAFPGSTIHLLARKKKNEAMPSAIRVRALRDGKPIEWNIAAQMVSGSLSPLPQLWAREKIRELERGVGGKSLQENRRLTARTQKMIEISQKYQILSRQTSFLIIERREGKDRVLDELVFVNVPALVTRDWHGGKVRLEDSVAFQAKHFILPDTHEMLCRTVGFLRHSVDWEEENDNDEDLLYDLLSAQLHQGGFEARPDLLERLGVSRKDLEKAARQLNVADVALALRILFTALVLYILENWYGPYRDIWEAVVTKSREWFELETGSTRLRVGAKPLTQWVDEFAKSLRKPK